MSNVYISKSLRKDMPSDAVVLSRSEVISMHWNTILEWKPSLETWPFRYGVGTLTGLTGSTAFVISNVYRQKLKLGNYGRVTMMVPAVAIPTIAASWGHFTNITSSVLLGDECPLCIQTRAAFVQVGCAVVFPALASPIAAYAFALQYGTYNVPPLKRSNFPEIMSLTWKLMKSLRSRVPISIVINSIAAMAVTYFEAESFYGIQSKIYQQEENFRKQIYG